MMHAMPTPMLMAELLDGGRTLAERELIDAGVRDPERAMRLYNEAAGENGTPLRITEVRQVFGGVRQPVYRMGVIPPRKPSNDERSFTRFEIAIVRPDTSVLIDKFASEREAWDHALGGASVPEIKHAQHAGWFCTRAKVTVYKDGATPW